MKATRLFFPSVFAVAICLWPGRGAAQSSQSSQYTHERRPPSSATRSTEKPALFRGLFGKRKGPVEAPSSVPGTPAPAAPLAQSSPVQVPVAVAGQPAVAGPPAPAAVPVVLKPGKTSEAQAGVGSTSASVAAAIHKIAAGKSGSEVISSASKALDGNQEELKTLARSVEGDPSKILAEGKKLLNDPKVTASARQALDAMTKESAGGKVTASSLEEMKHLAEKVAGDPGLVAEGKQLLSANPDLMAQGRQLVEENKSLLASGTVKEKVAEARGKLAQIKTPVVIPASTALPAGPLPPWVDKGVPLPRDPVVDPIPRPEVRPEEVTRITAEFARFDANTNLVTFEENVELRHHQFDLQCQVLEAELAPGNQPGGQVDPGMAKAQAAAGGIRRATAKGFVIIQKLSVDGKIQVAKSRQAVYDAMSGDAVLSDFPLLQDGKNLISATSQTTKIHLRKNGKYEVIGPATYEIVPEGDGLKNLQR